MSERNQSTPGPLADLRVLDLSAVPAGPGIARHLADFGADLIKVERAGGVTRPALIGGRCHLDTVLSPFSGRR